MHLRHMTLYSIFVRNHGGSFAAVERDLPRIRELGVDAVWLMPIHPIGQKNRKGSLGSPYAISDYRAVNPEYGTMDDFVRLADTAHGLGMKLLIDVVYNHTSPDSLLAEQHPEWFYHKPDGSFGNRIGDWSDVIDLDYGQAPKTCHSEARSDEESEKILAQGTPFGCRCAQNDMWDYQIETLCFRAKYVDGFRCDVAPLVPLDFWKRARQAVEAVRPGAIWLAESVEPEFIAYVRSRGMTGHSDGELYQAFDVCYDYDVLGEYQAYVRGECTLEHYLAALRRQQTTYPADFVKLRCLENHDRPRMGFLFPTPVLQRNWLAWSFFQQGMALLYSGQEWAPAHRPTLFDPDPVAMEGEPVHAELIRRLCAMKKDPLFAEGIYEIKACPNDLVLASYRLGERRAVGLFSLKGNAGVATVDLPDGSYRNLIDGNEALVEFGMLATDGEPVILVR